MPLREAFWTVLPIFLLLLGAGWFARRGKQRAGGRPKPLDIYPHW